MHGERADQRHRHGEHRDQRRAPVLQEQEHDEQRPACIASNSVLTTSSIDASTNGVGVVQDRSSRGPAGSPALELRRSCALTGSAVSSALAPGSRKIADRDRRVAVELAGEVVVAARRARRARRRAGGRADPSRLRADDDALELARRRRSRPRARHRVLEASGPARTAAGRSARRRPARSARGSRAPRRAAVSPQARHLVGVAARSACRNRDAEDAHVADALGALQLVDDVDVRVVAEEQPVVASVGRVQLKYISDVGRLLARP